MNVNRVVCLFSLVAACVVAPSVSFAQLPIHRWSFNNPAGAAPDGSVVTDSIGGAHGMVRGANSLFTGSGVDLPGGSMDTEGYIDLPNGLISGHTQVTFEGWVTIDGGGNSWGRIFDFGSTNPGGLNGEVTGPGNTNGGGTDGFDYIMLSASRGTDYNVQRVEWRERDPVDTATSTFDSGVVTNFGEQIHFAVTVDSTGGTDSIVNYWRDGVALTTGATATGKQLSNVNDVNNWLGRSTWLGDANLNATYDEFRIYDTVLTEQEVLSSMQAGPNGIVPEPSAVSLAIVGLLGMMAMLWRRRRQR